MKDIKLGEIIRNGRKRMGLTKSELARLMNVSHAAVSYWEDGSVFPAGETLIYLFRRLNIVPEVFPEYFSYQVQAPTPPLNPVLKDEQKFLVLKDEQKFLEARIAAIEKQLSSKNQ